MTSVDANDLPAPDPGLLVIESFLDGEPVNPQVLAEALTHAEGRDYLVELLALRDAVSTTGPHGWAMPDRKRTPARRGVPWLAAAAGVVLSLTTGYVAGQETAVAPAMESGVEVVVDSAAPALPEPTRVISLQPGVNWTESSGGR